VHKVHLVATGFTCFKHTAREWIANESWLAGACRNMVDNRALSVSSTYTRTRIDALIPKASSVSLAIGTMRALGLTSFIRIAVIIFDTSTSPGVIPSLAYGIGAARRGLARIWRRLHQSNALDEWVAGKSARARADGRMINDRAFGILATRSGARVLAFFIDTRLTRVAVGIYQALWSAIRWRSNVALKTRAYWIVIDVLANGIRSTRGRVARRFYFWFYSH
jgi:hypothetical protein